MSESVFDKIAGRSAVNKQSARSAFGGGLSYNWEPKPSTIINSKTPFPIKPTPPDAPKLEGMKFGRFTVIGMYDRPNQGNCSRGVWVVRCACGDYETRTSKAVRNPNNAQDRCQHCRRLEYLRSQDRRSAFGDKRANEIRDAEISKARAKT